MNIDKKMVRFEIKPLNSEYFVCNLIGYNSAGIGIYSGGFTSYESACNKIKEVIKEQNQEG